MMSSTGNTLAYFDNKITLKEFPIICSAAGLSPFIVNPLPFRRKSKIVAEESVFISSNDKLKTLLVFDSAYFESKFLSFLQCLIRILVENNHLSNQNLPV